MQFEDIRDLPSGTTFKVEPNSRAGKAGPGGNQPDISNLELAELLDLRARVNEALPARSLKDIDLSNELVIQVLALQVAQQKALSEEATPTNQLAQAMSALTSALTTLVRLQSDTYTSERLKKIEAILIEALNTLPTEAQEAFLGAYEVALGRVT